MGTTRVTTRVRLARGSMHSNSVFKRLVTATLLLAIALAVYGATLASPEFGRPSQWTQIVLPIALVLFLYGTVYNGRLWLRATGLLPVAVVVVGSTVKIASPLKAAFGMSTEVAAGTPIRLTVRREVVTTRRASIDVLELRVEARTDVLLRLVLPEAQRDYDWEGWARSSFAEVPGLAVYSR